MSVLVLILALPRTLFAAEPMLPPSGDPWAVRPVTTATLKQGAQVYTFCASCHLADGGGRPDGAIPRLAGQPAVIVAGKLNHIRAGTTYLPVMAAFANSLSPAEVTAVAEYIAALPAPKYVGHGDGNALDLGRRTYATQCAGCHGPEGEGNAALLAPRLCGQHAGYLWRRFDEILRNDRGDANAGMAAIVREMVDEDLAATADYLSRGSCAAAGAP